MPATMGTPNCPPDAAARRTGECDVRTTFQCVGTSVPALDFTHPIPQNHASQTHCSAVFRLPSGSIDAACQFGLIPRNNAAVDRFCSFALKRPLTSAMSIARAEQLKRDLTDKFVVVADGVPELRRFRGLTGRVKTVNMSCRVLVQFDGPADIGWYDIDPSYLAVVDGAVKVPPMAAEEKAAKQPTEKSTKRRPISDVATPANLDAAIEFVEEMGGLKKAKEAVEEIEKLKQL